MDQVQAPCHDSHLPYDLEITITKPCGLIVLCCRNNVIGLKKKKKNLLVTTEHFHDSPPSPHFDLLTEHRAERTL
jgi:hypothetical protein